MQSRTILNLQVIKPMNPQQIEKVHAYIDKGMDLYNRGNYQLGEVLRKTGKHRKAAACHTKALSILKKIFGQDHPDIAQSLHNLGKEHPKTRDYKRGRKEIEQKLRQRRESPWLQP